MSESILNSLNVSISAVVVVYNDYQSLGVVTNSLRGQVDVIIVVDNSDAEHIMPEYILKDTDAVYHRVNSNKGLGMGLNIGISLSEKKSSDWVLLLDQDSVVSEGMVALMLEEYEQRLEQDRIGLICPTVVLQGNNNHQYPLSFGTVLTNMLSETSDKADFAITSGSMVKMSVLLKIGLMDENFFIDYIDYDFCLRLRGEGYKILYVRDAVLNHSLGERKVSTIGIEHTTHASERVYYQTRNRLITVKRHGARFPAFALIQLILFMLKFFKILILEDHKLTRLRYYFAGIVDFFRNRYSPV